MSTVMSEKKTSIMKAISVLAGLSVIFASLSVSCKKESVVDPIGITVTEGQAKALWPRVRFRYNYEFINGCSGGECGGCVGVCVFWPVRLGPAPKDVELRDGIGRAQLVIEGGMVVLAPMDLPMDPGTGKVIIDHQWTMVQDVASMLGYSAVELWPGTYDVDHSKGDRFGRIVVPADLLP